MSEETNMSHQEHDRPLIEVERARPEDAEMICDIRDRAWLAAYPNAELGITPEMIKLNAEGAGGEFVPRRIAYLKGVLAPDRQTDLTVYVARANGKVVAFTEPSQDERGRKCISTIYVDPDFQGQGIGGKLMQKALDVLGRGEDIFLDVVRYNTKAIEFYKKFGFEITDAVVPADDEAPDYMTQLPQVEMMLRAA